MTELEKVAAIKAESQAIGEFLDWLRTETEYQVCTMHHHDEACYAGEMRVCSCFEGQMLLAPLDIEALLARFFEVDLAKVEQERAALLAAVKGRNDV